MPILPYIVTLGMLVAGRAPSAADVPVVPRAEDPPRFEFTSFGASQPLARADRIVEARPESIVELPVGTTVVRMKVLATLLPAAEEAPEREVVVLAARGEIRSGSDYLLFLSRFRSGGRYSVLARIASGDREYAAKKKVLTAFSAVDRIAVDADRTARIRDLLIVHADDADRAGFVRWNAVSELKALATLRPETFGPEQRAKLVAMATAERLATLRDAFRELLKLLGVELERTDRG